MWTMQYRPNQTCLSTASQCRLFSNQSHVRIVFVFSFFQLLFIGNSVHTQSLETLKSVAHTSRRTLCFHYKDKSVNDVWGKNALYFKNHVKYIQNVHGYTVHQRYQSFIVQLMHIHSLLKQLKL